jgi:hypothetical protein
LAKPGRQLWITTVYTLLNTCSCPPWPRKKMATITKLPPELILDILGSFEDDKVTLCRLSLVSSFFVEAAQQLLSRHLVLSVDMPLDGCETSFDKIITLFNQKPHLSVHVQTLVLSSRHSGLESSKSILRALNLLNRVTSLRYLDLKNALILPLWDMSPLTSDPFLETNPLTRLTKLKLTSPWISWSGIAIFLYLPSLEHLSLVHLPSGHAPSTLSESRGKICPIRTLELSTWGGQSGTPLKSLLELTNKLEFLGLAMISSESFFLPSYTVLEISKALVPVRDTLKVLKVKGECSADAHPGSRLDLSGFKILEKVDVLSSLLFSARSADRSRDGLFKLLPRSLVELQVRHNFSRYAYSDIFWTVDRLRWTI